MSGRVATLLIYEDGERRWTHELPPGSSVQHLNSVQGYAGKVSGPTHKPYWLTVDGAISKKAP